MTLTRFAPLFVQELDRPLQGQRLLRQRGVAPAVGDEGAVMAGLGSSSRLHPSHIMSVNLFE